MHSELNEMETPELKYKVQKALYKLFKNDSFLLYADVNERSISHKFAEYLQQEFDEWNVDCEYNRDYNETKKLNEWKSRCMKKDLKPEEDRAKTVYPDIIIHHRNTSNNLLVIEIKKSENRDEGECDIEKILNFIEDSESLYNYSYGLFINFKVKGKCGIHNMKWLPEEKFKEGDHFD